MWVGGKNACCCASCVMHNLKFGFLIWIGECAVEAGGGGGC